MSLPFADWVAKLFPRASHRARRAAARAAGRPSAPLGAEALEERIVFATRIWTGLGPDSNWTTAANWAGNVAPQADDSLGILAGGNTFDGIVNLSQGVLNLRNSSALGSANAGTIAGLGTAIQLQGGITVPENIVVRDMGVGFDLPTLGAIRSVGTATNTLTGTIAMTNHGSFGVDPGGRLVARGQVMVEPNVSDGGLTLFGGGAL